MLLAGLLLGGVRSGVPGLLEGLRAGGQMVLRAVLALLGFTAIAVELRNPRILGWLEQRQLRGLSEALGAAFAALPAFTAALSGRRDFWRRPMAALGDMLRLADTLSERPPARHPGLVILTGSKGSGKTTRAGEVVALLREQGMRVAGILSPGLVARGQRTGFDLLEPRDRRAHDRSRESGNRSARAAVIDAGRSASAKPASPSAARRWRRPTPTSSSWTRSDRWRWPAGAGRTRWTR